MTSDKQTLRKEYKQRRTQLDKATKRKLDLEIQSKLLMLSEYRSSDKVFLYCSTDDEIDTLGILNAAFANKKRVALPVTNEDNSLSFYYINSLKELKTGRFNILEPTDLSKKADDFDNSICVVPSLCCDLSGNRIGYGKGCYDRFLSTYTGVKISLCYSDFIVLKIDAEDTDELMDVIVSDNFVKYI